MKISRHTLPSTGPSIAYSQGPFQRRWVFFNKGPRDQYTFFIPKQIKASITATYRFIAQSSPRERYLLALLTSVTGIAVACLSSQSNTGIAQTSINAGKDVNQNATINQ